MMYQVNRLGSRAAHCLLQFDFTFNIIFASRLNLQLFFHGHIVKNKNQVGKSSVFYCKNLFSESFS